MEIYAEKKILKSVSGLKSKIVLTIVLFRI